MGRYISIWFPHLAINRFTGRYPELADTPFVLTAPQRGRVMVTAASTMAEVAGIRSGMVLADARAILPALKVLDDRPDLAGKLLAALGEWAIRYSPEVAINLPDGLLLEVGGCAHLWGGELPYIKDISTRLQQRGYTVRVAMADTIGTAWAIARFGNVITIVQSGEQMEALLPLPPAALRLESSIIERLEKLGLRTIGSFIRMPRPALRRRLGQQLLDRLDQALGLQVESMQLIRPIVPYQERLPCLEPIRTRVAIDIAVKRLLVDLCHRLQKENNGLRSVLLHVYRLDGDIQKVSIGTNRPTRNVDHLYKLFELKLGDITPDLGIELFILEGLIVEPLPADVEKLWQIESNGNNAKVAELLDRISIKVGKGCIHRYLPSEHYWPERSFREATSISEKNDIVWRDDLPRPIHLLTTPLLVQVMVPLPDYPPIQFLYQGQWHKIRKADGPERIEQEWWLQDGLHRDYYCVEDMEGRRYWLFRSGHYNNEKHGWFLHGFFA